ncbi:hypothetical protein RB195_009703 [Necator americanus]|uniref:Hexosyltransferase n=1 Tax=Necator americanus TaxID=51031 RepID=A0ABR1CUK0_NECAM
MVFKTKVQNERLPNQSFYYDILFREANSLNLTSPSIHDESKLVVIVCTALRNAQIRDTIRRTWANPQLSKAVNSRFISVVFLVGTEKVTDVVWKELKTFSDILQVDVQESYANLVYKLLAGYRWIRDNHPSKFVLKMDSDVVILLDRVESIIGDSKSKTLRCYSHKNAIPIRKASNPWYIPESVYPENYLPAYCSGPAYLMTPAALTAILQVAPEEKKLSQPCINNRGTVISYPLHSASPTRLAEGWDHLRYLRCRWPIEHLLLKIFYND